MSIEIERKFLVKPDFPKKQLSKKSIRQGFLNTDPERSVRVRILNDKGFLTIKGKSNKAGTSRFEFETEIPLTDAEILLSMCINNLIEKTRYYFPLKSHIIEIDVFEGVNKGLITAEIEINSEDDIFEIPDWFTNEVTGDIKYYNLYLSETPFSLW